VNVLYIKVSYCRTGSLDWANHIFYFISVWRFFIWAWLPCSLGIFWFRSTLFGTTNFVKWTMTQLRLTKPHWLSWKILSPPVFESFLEIWHWVWKIVKSDVLFIRCQQPILNLYIYEFTKLQIKWSWSSFFAFFKESLFKRQEEASLDLFSQIASKKKKINQISTKKNQSGFVD
jgi:hypothetical protein